MTTITTKKKLFSVTRRSTFAGLSILMLILAGTLVGATPTKSYAVDFCNFWNCHASSDGWGGKDINVGVGVGTASVSTTEHVPAGTLYQYLRESGLEVDKQIVRYSADDTLCYTSVRFSYGVYPD